MEATAVQFKTVGNVDPRLINPPLNRDYNRDPNIKAFKRRGVC